MRLIKDMYSLTNLSTMVDSEYSRVRPVMVIQKNIGNRFSAIVMVAVITARISEAKLPTHVKLDAGKFNF
ncbi:type II toxin-antitoxin system PemK/MazF family toxin [Bacillus thuringiensis]|uniref:type II toxin-antitoxin system PemK/MazF family toxin n=1 Tax=Bacillus thuringiensis TaxID=1428 RepID=UPI000944C093